MEYPTRVTFNEIIQIRTEENFLPSDLIRFVSSMESLYNIHLFFIMTEPSNNYNNDLIWSKEFLEIRDAAYPDGQSDPVFQESVKKMEDILPTFNESRDLNNYIDIIDAVPLKLKLRINSIRKNSPLNIELIGLGKAIKEFKNLVLSLVSIGSYIKQKKLEVKEKEINIAKKALKLKREEEKLKKEKLENYHRILELCKEYGLTPEMVSKISNDFANANKNIEKLLEESKIETMKIEEDE